MHTYAPVKQNLEGGAAPAFLRAGPFSRQLSRLDWAYVCMTRYRRMALVYQRVTRGHFALGLGFYYPLGKGNLAPYVGGGLGYHWTDTGGAGGSGLALRAAVGLIVGRLSTVQVRLEAGYHASLYEEGPATDYLGQPEPGATVRANGPMLSVGLGF